MSVKHLCWPLSGLGNAVTALTGKQGDPLPPPASAEVLAEWVTWAALRSNVEVNAADIVLRDLDWLLTTASPTLYEMDGSYLVVLQAGKTLTVLAPDLSRQRVRSDVVAAAVRAAYEAPHRANCQALLEESGIAPARLERALAALLSEQTGASRFQRCWTFRDNTDKLRVWRGVPQLIASHAAQYLLWIASWAVLGTLSFTGHMDRGWITAWALLLATLIPFRLLTLWTQGTFAIGLGTMLKQRLLRGALRLEPEEVRAGGVGSFLGQALQAEAIETLATSGGITGLLAFVELIPAMFILGRLAIALIIWSGVAIFAAWQFYRSYKRWTAKLMELTNHLVEMMVGQRTRLAQQPREDRHTSEDSSLAQYRSMSASLDQTGSWMVAGIPRGWLLLGILCLAPSLAAGHALSSETAILLGGVLLGFSAFQRLVASFADVAAALTSWQVIKPLIDAASRRELTGELPPVRKETRTGQRLLEADRLTFRYSGHAAAALQGVNLSIRCGEKVLLEGPSGGGKTTLASLLTGLRKPESGLLLVNGFDRHTLGESGWRKQVAAAPQFHENHLVTETLAFNLLMGRNWPPSNKDMEEAEQVCSELGLADLIGRMPSGLMQMIGEGGWQLSHGERSRIFLARALLQHADLVILDESFAALDPENLQIAMKTTLRRAETLLVIAHP